MHSRPLSGKPQEHAERSTDRLVDRAIATRLAKSIGMKWRMLGRSLGMEEAILSNIEADHTGLQERAYQMFSMWSETRPQTATVNVLVKHLQDVGRADLKIEIQEMVKDIETSASNQQNSETRIPSLNGPESSVDVEVMIKVASSIGKHWKWLGRQLDFRDHQLENIEMNNKSTGIYEMAFQTLMQWKERDSLAATTDLLATHLRSVGRVDLACEVLQMTKRPNTHARSLKGLPMSQTSTTSSHVSEIWASFKSASQIMQDYSIPGLPWLKKPKIKSENYFIGLTVMQNNGAKRNLELNEIFKLSEDSAHSKVYNKRFKLCEQKEPKRILIEGCAGYGKSTLAQKLCFDHANNQIYIRHFEAVILLNLGEFKGTLEEMIINTLQLKDYKVEEVVETITQNQQKLLLILDGFDELPEEYHKYVILLLQGNHLPQATVIVTSRPENIHWWYNDGLDSSVTGISGYMDSRIIIEGITDENQIRFLKLFSSHSFHKMDSIKRLFQLFKKDERNIFNCPLFLFLLVVASEETDIALLTTKTELYMMLFNFVLRRALLKEDQTKEIVDFFNFDKHNPPVYVEMLARFGSFAGECLRNNKHSFTEEEIIAACGNDNVILKLGILTQRKSKRTVQRTAWFEPLHLSFLEFSYAYCLWFRMFFTQHFSSFPFPRKISKVKKVLKWCNLVIPFLFGLCGNQHPTTLPNLFNDHDSLLEALVYTDYQELMAESKLKQSELSQAILHLIKKQSGDLRITNRFLQNVLLKEILNNAVQTSKLQRIILEQDFIVTSQQFNTQPLKVKPRRRESEFCLSQKDSTLITNQNLVIEDVLTDTCTFVITIFEAPLELQLNWLSNFMIIDELYTKKPIHKIEYRCSEPNLATTIIKLSELVHQDRLESVKFDSHNVDCTPNLQHWKEFLHHAMLSDMLLDMKLNIHLSTSLLTVDLGGKHGKTWREIELIGDVVPRVGSLLCSQHELKNFMKEVPTRIQSLRVKPHLSDFPVCKFQYDGPSMVHTLSELRLTLNNNVSFQSYLLGNLFNLHFLGIGLTTDFTASEQEPAHLVSSIVFNCCHLKNLELMEGFTDKITASFLQLFHKKTCTEIKGNTRQRLETMILSDFCPSSTPGNATANLTKKVFSDCLQHLRIRCTKDKEGSAKQEFMQLFSPTDGYSCELEVELAEESDGSKLNNVWSMFIFKIRDGNSYTPTC